MHDGEAARSSRAEALLPVVKPLHKTPEALLLALRWHKQTKQQFSPVWRLGLGCVDCDRVGWRRHGVSQENFPMRVSHLQLRRVNEKMDGCRIGPCRHPAVSSATASTRTTGCAGGAMEPVVTVASRPRRSCCELMRGLPTGATTPSSPAPLSHQRALVPRPPLTLIVTFRLATALGGRLAKPR